MQNYITVPILNGNGGSVATGTASIGTTLIFVCPVPDDNLGGGITVTDFTGYAYSAIAAGSAPQLALVTLSSAYAINGTVWNLGSAAYGAGTPNTGTASTVWVDRDDGHYYLAIQHAQVAALTVSTIALSVSIGYQQGR